MPDLAGTLTLDLQFRDSTSSVGVQSLNAIALREFTQYTTGKAAVVSGTVGTSAETLWSQSDGLQFGGYRDAAGQFVTFALVEKVAFKLNAVNNEGAFVEDTDTSSFKLLAKKTDSVVSSNSGSALAVQAVAGTASFTAVLYGT